MTKTMCRFCNAILKNVFVDLGMSPLANSFVSSQGLKSPEKFYPLRTFVCKKCLLVQLEEFEAPEKIFQNYAYYSSFSTSWLNHSAEYFKMIINRFNLTPKNKIIEVASNDGYLLKYFQRNNFKVLGIEPAENVAKTSINKGIPTIVHFFGEDLARKLVEEGERADLLIANNVLAHVPDLHDFIKGLKILLNTNGTITVEFPHLLNLISKVQFDTIYHEHFSYFSLITVKEIFKHHNLEIFDVEELQTHGGSLRLFVKHFEDRTKKEQKNVSRIINKEREFGLHNLEIYKDFPNQVQKLKTDILRFLIDIKSNGKTIAGYGAPAKGNTLLNYCGIKTDFLPFTVDKNSFKQGMSLPGTRIPIKSVATIKEKKPDYLLILPWNLKDEIMSELEYIRDWGGKFVVCIPKIEVIL